MRLKSLARPFFLLAPFNPLSLSRSTCPTEARRIGPGTNTEARRMMSRPSIQGRVALSGFRVWANG